MVCSLSRNKRNRVWSAVPLFCFPDTKWSAKVSTILYPRALFMLHPFVHACTTWIAICLPNPIGVHGRPSAEVLGKGERRRLAPAFSPGTSRFFFPGRSSAQERPGTQTRGGFPSCFCSFCWKNGRLVLGVA